MKTKERRGREGIAPYATPHHNTFKPRLLGQIRMPGQTEFTELDMTNLGHANNKLDKDITRLSFLGKIW